MAVQACGLCGSDLFLQDGGFGRDLFPVVPGHEAAGTIVELGAGPDDDLSVGDQVALWYLDQDPAGPWPQAGLPHLGPDVTRMGVDLDGALARFVVRPRRTLVGPRAPIAPTHLAVLTDAVATPFHALTAVAGVTSSDTVVVFGLGGIGATAVEVARVLGARVVAVGRSARSRELATKLGAVAVVENSPTAVEEVRQLTDGGADVALVCTDAPGVVAQAAAACRPRGRVVLVAATRAALDLSPVDLIWPELTLSGSRGFTAEDIRAVQDLYLDGSLHIDHLVQDVRTLAETTTAFEDLRRGGLSRIVIDPSAAVQSPTPPAQPREKS